MLVNENHRKLNSYMRICKRRTAVERKRQRTISLRQRIQTKYLLRRVLSGDSSKVRNPLYYDKSLLLFED